MKSILISIKPKYVAKILNGEKTIEIRKTMPKCDLSIDVYIYATKRQNLVLGDNFYGDWVTEYTITRGWSKENVERIWGNLSGKVVAKFTLNKVEEIKQWYQPAESSCYNDYDDWEYETENLGEIELKQKSCLTSTELYEYLGNDLSEYTKVGYAWHISNLEIFDEPKELSEFRHWVSYKNCKKCSYKKYYGRNPCLEIETMTKAPQSWCYVEVL